MSYQSDTALFRSWLKPTIDANDITLDVGDEFIDLEKAFEFQDKLEILLRERLREGISQDDIIEQVKLILESFKDATR